jgi:hypothetical protein
MERCDMGFELILPFLQPISIWTQPSRECDLLQALNTGHAWNVSTIHGKLRRAAPSRFGTSVLQSGLDHTQPSVTSSLRL